MRGFLFVEGGGKFEQFLPIGECEHLFIFHDIDAGPPISLKIPCPGLLTYIGPQLRVGARSAQVHSLIVLPLSLPFLSDDSPVGCLSHTVPYH